MLTDVKARQAKAGAKDYKLADSGGLYLYVTTKGYKSWRMKYRIGSKEKRVTFGPYPDVSITDARDLRDSSKRLLRDGKDPAIEQLRKKLAAAADSEQTFEAVARRWHGMHASRWTPVHASDVIRSLEREIFPNVGKMPINELDPQLVLAVLRKVEARGSLETAKRIRQRMSAVFVFAISEGIGTNDPAAIVAKALKPARKATKQPAITDLRELRTLLAKSEDSGASPVTLLASRLLALTSVRSAIVRGAQWGEFEGIDWETGDRHQPMWRVPSERMKLALDQKGDETFEHLVPLSQQAVDVLLAIRPLTARFPVVFPGQRHAHRPLSENAIGYLYNRVGYYGRHVPHGWRAAFSTIMNEIAEREGRATDRAVIDLMLAHMPKDRVESRYNRAAFMERRREIAQAWANLLTEELQSARDVLRRSRR